jgi:hypothetical protein
MDLAWHWAWPKALLMDLVLLMAWHLALPKVSLTV